jgi:hypothetical protein
MKYCSILVLVFCLGIGDSFGQNLIPNPSFEELSPANFYIFHGDTSFYTTPLKCWAGPSYNGFTHIHENGPYTLTGGPFLNQPRTGLGTLVLEQTRFYYQNLLDSTPDFRQYAQTKLIEPLVAGQVYTLKFYVAVQYISSINPNYNYQITYLNNLGIHFSNSRNTDFSQFISRLIWSQQLNFNIFNFGQGAWTEITINYTATGGERYLAIGNFDHAANFQIFNGPPTLSTNEGVGTAIQLDDMSLIPFGSTNTANPNANLGPDTTICGTSVNMTITAASGFDQYLWNTGDTTQSIQITQPGTYSVNVNDECSLCNDTIVVSLQPFLNLDLGNDTLICVDNSVQLQLASNHSNLNSYNWSSGQNTPSISVNTAGTYILEANYACGTLRDTIIVNTQAKPGKPIFSDTSVCINSGDFQPLATGTNLLWFNDEFVGTGSTLAPTISSANIDTFDIWVSQTINTCESDRYKQIITVMDLPYFTLINDTTMCEFNDTKFGPRESSWEYLWNDGYDKSPRVFENSGYYILQTTNDCGNFSQSIEVEIEECPCTMFFPEAITANGDGLNDFLTATYFCDLESYELKVFNRWGQAIFTSENPLDHLEFGNDFPQGVYQLICVYKGKLTQEETIIQKLVVLR